MKARKPYSAEFRQEAVRLATEQGLSASETARDLGIDAETLHRWRRAQVSATAAATESAPDTADLTRLRRDSAELRCTVLGCPRHRCYPALTVPTAMRWRGLRRRRRSRITTVGVDHTLPAIDVPLSISPSRTHPRTVLHLGGHRPTL